ncbi:TerC family protein [Roseomonas arctica]|uniref:TerC family protein n=2 Tax=Plastoroseomonas arctica TaxID=1509237 RepID=A0AAF1JY70_9PROT|nr:TerC family protein [Plastoroseomonas arctica]
MIDVVLAGDNAIVVGMAAAGLAPEQRRKAILWGIIAATVMRIAFASITAQLLAIVGITLVGGLLLVWVCWKMYRELRRPNHAAHADLDGAAAPQGKTMRQAIIQILVADISMSLDNVLAVAGAAKDHPYILIVGLAISVVLMGVAASLIANLLTKHKWIAWVGLLIIVYVAFDMILSGSVEVANQVPENYAFLMLPMGFLARPDIFPAWLWVAATLVQLVIYTTIVTFVGGLVRDAQRGPERAHG